MQVWRGAATGALFGVNCVPVSDLRKHCAEISAEANAGGDHICVGAARTRLDEVGRSPDKIKRPGEIQRQP